MQSKIKLSVVIGLLSLIISGLAGYRVTQLLIESSYWVEHSYEVKGSLEVVLSLLDDAETGQRGFLLTGNSLYLEPFESSKLKIPDALESYRILTSDNHFQLERVDRIVILAEFKLAELSKTINLYKTGNRAGALELVNTDSGKQWMDDIRAIINEMQSEQSRLLVLREQEEKSTIQIAILTTSLGSFLAFSIIVGIAISLGGDARRYIIARDSAELELGSTIEQLEKSLVEIKTLEGIIPICSYCKVIRNDEGAWIQLESYISSHSDADFSHGICPKCLIRVRAEEGL